MRKECVCGDVMVFFAFQICHNVLYDGWSVVRASADGGFGPYAHKGDQWVSFDDVDTIETKVSYLRSMGLAGVMVWSIDLDDFNGSCRPGKTYPLLKAVNRGLGRIEDGNFSAT